MLYTWNYNIVNELHFNEIKNKLILKNKARVISEKIDEWIKKSRIYIWYSYIFINTAAAAALVSSVMSVSLQLYGLQPARLLCPWDSLGKSTRVGCHALLQGTFPTQGQTWVSCIEGRWFTMWTTREAYNICLWFISPSIIPFRSTHVVGNDKFSFFLWMSSI